MTIGPTRRKLGDFLVGAGVALMANTLVLWAIGIGTVLSWGPISVGALCEWNATPGVGPVASMSAVASVLFCLVGMFVRWKFKLALIAGGVALAWLVHFAVLFAIPPDPEGLMLDLVDAPATVEREI